jgi:hypothetical protein
MWLLCNSVPAQRELYQQYNDDTKGNPDALVSERYFLTVMKRTHPEIKCYKNCHLAKCACCIRLKAMISCARDNPAKQDELRMVLKWHRMVSLCPALAQARQL